MYRFTAPLSVLLIFALLLESLVLPVGAQEADEDAADPVPEWPREITAPNAVVVVYQPQPETFAGDKLTARAAVSVTPKGDKEPIFGAIWMEATVRTDREERIVDLVGLKVKRVRFPDATDDQEKRLAALVEKDIMDWSPEISLDRLLTSLDSAKVEAQKADRLKNDAPKFRFVTEPTELVILSGKPELRPLKDTKLMKVINTMYLVVLDPGTKAYYLNLGKLWMTAPDLLKGPWTKAVKVPAEVQAQTPKPDPEADADAEPIDESIVPKVIVVEEIEELITLDGEPKYSPLPGNELLYMSNTDSSIMMDIAQQQYYILAAGRWFVSKSLEGPWKFVAADKLPASFGKIPEDSDVGDVRSFVAGTDEAKDAVLDAQIPQTAAIKRDDKSLTVTYDGNPTFEAIEETNNLGYAINTQYAVLRDNRAAKPVFYCCWNGVWYVAPSPTGPWAIATAVADTIYTIPPSCKLYNVTYVKIYKVEPTVVYVGYLPGYTGCYVYGGTVVYGTGYYYTPWVGTVYYAAPVTYSVSVRYYPSLGRWFSPISVGGVVRRTRRRTRRRVNYRNNNHHHHHHHHHRSNQYNNHKGRTNQTNKNRSQANKNRAQTNNRNSQKNRKNNHYADKNGNVHRQNKNGSYQKKDKNGWSNSNKKNSSVQRDSQNRNRGSSRTNSYNKSSSSSRSRSGGGSRGGSRGGGGRRR